MDNGQVITALEEQVDCYRRLAKLAQQQHEHVQQNATDQLLLVLTSRQEVLDQIARLEKLVSPAKRAWGGFVTEMPPDRRQKAEALLAETRSLLEAITQSDRND